MTSITLLLCYYENLYEECCYFKNLYKKCCLYYNACELTVCEILNYILFCLYLAVILRNDVRIRF